MEALELDVSPMDVVAKKREEVSSMEVRSTDPQTSALHEKIARHTQLSTKERKHSNDMRVLLHQVRRRPGKSREHVDQLRL